jgi:hypothetical protein
MIESSQLGGNSLAIGDITQSYRAVLADGKRLVPCDGTLVNAATYPLLAAAMTPRQKLVKSWGVAPATGEIFGISVAEGSKVLAYTQLGAGELNSTNTITNAVTPIKTANGALIYAGVGASRDGKYILACYINTGQVQVSASSDFGATFSAHTVVASGTFVEPSVSIDSSMVDIWVSAAGTSIRVAIRCTTSSQSMRFFESTNFGITWNAIWVDATVYTSASLTRGMFSQDGQNYLAYPFAGSVSTLKLRVVAGVRTSIAGDVGIYPVNEQLEMVMSPDSNTLLVCKSNGNSSIANPALVISCSTDFGATWKPVPFDVSTLDYTIRGVRAYHMIHSLVVPNTIYVMVLLLGDTTVSSNYKLLALNYVTGEITTQFTQHYLQAASASAPSKFTLATSIANPAREYLTFVDPTGTLNVKSIYTIDYAKYLPLVVNNNSLPFKVVADKA